MSSDSHAPEPRSRIAVRHMPNPVLSHDLPASSTKSVSPRLYARKLPSDPPPRRDVLRWQAPLAYLIIAGRAGWLLTWHAPWCRRCNCPGAGWKLTFERGYWSGLGFELSFPRRRDS